MGKGSKPRNNYTTQFRDNYDNIAWDSSQVIDKEIEDMFYADDSTDNLAELSSEQREILMESARQTLRSKLRKNT